MPLRTDLDCSLPESSRPSSLARLSSAILSFAFGFFFNRLSFALCSDLQACLGLDTMVRVSLVAVLYAAATAVQAAKLKVPAVVPGAYIIEYEDGHVSALHSLDTHRHAKS